MQTAAIVANLLLSMLLIYLHFKIYQATENDDNTPGGRLDDTPSAFCFNI